MMEMKRRSMIVKLGLLITFLTATGLVTVNRQHEPFSGASDRESHTNRLIRESSPYLLQHAHNPVDWYPWGEEAFERARKENRPIFLSVGYSACHWCHVMERECFENDAIAKLLNEHFVSIKVDREERPDVDEVYMLATQLMTGRGGWPMSVFMTPDGKPFFAGTYFPREQFASLLNQIADAYANRGAEIRESADQFAVRLRQAAAEQFKPGPLPSEDVAADAIRDLEGRFDRRHGGFSQKPKFPPYNDLRLLMDDYARTNSESALGMVTRTLDEMALGGIYDHLGGGFHRYSTDERWLLPHFEKMLYDNAMLARVYAQAWKLTNNPLYRRRATDTLDWVLRDMRDKDGGFHSSVDADSEGEEGKYYVWTRAEILHILGKELGEVFCEAYNVARDGNYADEASGRKTGTNVIHLQRPLSELAAEMGVANLEELMAKARGKLLAARGKRVAPGLDDKVLTGWNGLMIGSLAYCGRVLGEDRYTKAAAAAADFVLKHLRNDGLHRRYRLGEAGVHAYLEDYAFLANGLLDLYETTGEKRWLDASRKLADEMLAGFRDPTDGGFYSTSHDGEQLLVRMKDVYDSAVPSSNGAAAEVLLRLHRMTGNGKYKDRAVETFKALSGAIARSPASASTLVRSLADYYAEVGPGVTARPERQVPATDQKGPVTASLTASPSADGAGEVQVVIQIQPGWHINSHEPVQDYLIPTSVSVSGPGITAGEASYPRGKLVKLGFSQESVSVYEGEVRLNIPFERSNAADQSSTRVTVHLSYQPCDDTTCLAPASMELSTELEFPGLL